MKPLRTVFFTALMFFYLIGHCIAAKPEEERGEWWVKRYGALSDKDHRLMPKVLSVFGRVLAAADKRGTRSPRLIIIRKEGDPWAVCLKDGTVLLTRKAMEFCYQGVDEHIGDARTAYVLGHELAHLAKDDFWHQTAFESVKRFMPESESKKEIEKLLMNTEDIDDSAKAREIRRKKEMESDGYGLLYAVMAGYDVSVIADENNNFFREWTSQITGKIAYSDEHHPSPEQRYDFLKSSVKSVINDIDLFRFGVRLYQLGRYEDALDFLTKFREKFPSREVFSNIGLSRYALALKDFAGYDPDNAFRYRLSTVLDADTGADILNRNTKPNRNAKKQFQEAVTEFKAACEKDPLYLPARVNLSAALIMSDKYSEAMAACDDALTIRRDDPQALNNRAIAMYLLGPSIGTDMFGQSSDALRDIIAKHPDFADPLYNIGRLRAERERIASAKESWEKYLNIESVGVYADIIRKTLNIPTQVSEAGTWQTVLKKWNILPPIPLGEPDAESEKYLSQFERHGLGFGNIGDKYYSYKDFRVLMLDGIIELVEMPIKENIAISSVGGKPKTIKGIGEMQTYIYDNFALDVQKDMVRKIVYFEKLKIEK